MQDSKKKQLNMISGDASRVVEGTTCFDTQAKQNVDCLRQRCPHWIPYQVSHNCVLIAAQEGPHTLQTIGQIYGLTRMRICQIEKEILGKIREAA
jgi:hypothetical protein